MRVYMFCQHWFRFTLNSFSRVNTVCIAYHNLVRCAIGLRGTVSGSPWEQHVFTHYRLSERGIMQAQSSYGGMSDCFRKTLQHEGYKGFYKGLFPNLLKVVPAASITYIVYEAMKKSLDLE
ncbi:hypothetical protein Leryth_005195 [Lithospermum erythrorhizon]|nr:hypothetical protein Leryth_005195 [Lithospermum erythrorhizon]